jgi:hypothetical protein
VVALVRSVLYRRSIRCASLPPEGGGPRVITSARCGLGLPAMGVANDDTTIIVICLVGLEKSSSARWRDGQWERSMRHHPSNANYYPLLTTHNLHDTG